MYMLTALLLAAFAAPMPQDCEACDVEVPALDLNQYETCPEFQIRSLECRDEITDKYADKTADLLATGCAWADLIDTEYAAQLSLCATLHDPVEDPDGYAECASEAESDWEDAHCDLEQRVADGMDDLKKGAEEAFQECDCVHAVAPMELAYFVGRQDPNPLDNPDLTNWCTENKFEVGDYVGYVDNCEPPQWKDEDSQCFKDAKQDYVDSMNQTLENACGVQQDLAQAYLDGIGQCIFDHPPGTLRDLCLDDVQYALDSGRESLQEAVEEAYEKHHDQFQEDVDACPCTDPPMTPEPFSGVIPCAALLN